VRLDGRHDVAHLPTAAAGESSHERPITHDDEVFGCLRHHEVVLDADDPRARATQDPAPQDTHRLHWRGSIEGRRGGCAPVDDQRLVVVVPDPEPTDVAHLALPGLRVLLAEVQPPEDEPFVLLLEGRAPTCRGIHEGVALEETGHLLVTDIPRAIGAAAGQTLGGDAGGPGVGLGQLRIHPVDVGLLSGHLGGGDIAEIWAKR